MSEEKIVTLACRIVRRRWRYRTRRSYPPSRQRFEEAAAWDKTDKATIAEVKKVIVAKGEAPAPKAKVPAKKASAPKKAKAPAKRKPAPKPEPTPEQAKHASDPYHQPE